MRKKILVGLTTGLFLVVLVGVSQAAPILMEGDYIRTAISDNGTLGWGSTTSPGLQHDPTGTRTFGVDDYLTPGSPCEIFSVNSDQSGLRTNNNTGSFAMLGAVSDTSASSVYDHHVTWTGGYSGDYAITTESYFNDGDERIGFTTTLTALSDLTNLSFLRAIDPDPDVNTFGSFFTDNGRGYDSNDDGDFDDPDDIAPEDWVHSEGTSTGLTLGLYSDSTYTHNTGVSSGWSNDPSFYLNGTDNGNGDYTIGIAFNIGDLVMGDSAAFDYAYVMGESLEDASTPTAPVPEPSTILLMGAGLLGLVGYSRKRSSKKS